VQGITLDNPYFVHGIFVVIPLHVLYTWRMF